MSIRVTAVIASLAIIIMLAGCSGGIPVATDFDGTVANNEATLGEGVFMRGKLHIDLDTMTAEITPYRSSAAVGDLFGDLEITSFLIYPFCSDATCLYVKGLGVIPGTPPDIQITIGVSHPFGRYAGDPPTGMNRADLDLFDLRVYMINDGGTDPNPEVVQVTGLADDPIYFTPGLVVNADGYDDGADAIAVDASDGLTFDETVEVTSYNYAGQTTMQPYMRVFHGPEDPFVFVPGGEPIAGDNRMSHGESDECTFVLSLQPGAGAVEFDIAIAGGYGASAQGRINRTPSLVRYFKSFRATRPFIELMEPAITEGEIGVSNPMLNFSIVHPWAGLAPATSLDEYQNQFNNGDLLPPGANGPGEADLTFACRLVNADTMDEYDFMVLPVADDGTGNDAEPWLFALDLDDPTDPGNPLPDGTYNVYIYVKADVGDLTAFPFVGDNSYTLFYREGLLIESL